MLTADRLLLRAAAAKGSELQRRERAMREWRDTVKAADWGNFADVRQTFNHADVYHDCVIFDVGGNRYRIISKVRYQKHIVFIRVVLTHKEYDENKWCSDCE
ncbi:MAG TPA: type II toxin-antitoxin system HigB family toxin [Pyrinomonadaceae bacterium]|nr:type II toxin-antitoxin system HigB family toxin [Pyrinomonadaceae bacterium]